MRDRGRALGLCVIVLLAASFNLGAAAKPRAIPQYGEREYFDSMPKGNDWPPNANELYQTYGQHSPAWDKAVMEVIESSIKSPLAIAQTLRAALDSDCRCPIVRYAYISNLGFAYPYGFRPSEASTMSELERIIADTAGRPELSYIRFMSFRRLAWYSWRTRDAHVARAVMDRMLDMDTAYIDWSTMNSALEEATRWARQECQDQFGPSAAPQLVRGATKAQVGAYIRGLLSADDKERSLGTTYMENNDRLQGGWPRPQSTMYFDDDSFVKLRSLGPQNLDVLVENLGESKDRRLYMDCVIKPLVREEDKPLILRWLPLKTRLAEVVYDHGWERDAAAELTRRLAMHPRTLPMTWVKCVARLRDPKTYDDMKWYLLNGSGLPKSDLYFAMRDLPGMDVQEAATQLWARFRSAPGLLSADQPGAAIVAVDQGIVAALDYLVHCLGHPVVWSESRTVMYLRDTPDPMVDEAPRQLVMRYTGQQGSDEELRAWFERNKDKLQFDIKRRRFYVADARAESEAKP